MTEETIQKFKNDLELQKETNKLNKPTGSFATSDSFNL
jgi:hypothetical protein